MVLMPQFLAGGRSKQRGARRLATYVDNARAVVTVAEKRLYFQLAALPDAKTISGAFNLIAISAIFNSHAFEQVSP